MAVISRIHHDTVNFDAIPRRAIRHAMFDLAIQMADELEQPTEVALRQPVSMGAVLNDLAVLLGIDPPAVVLAAISEPVDAFSTS